MTRKPIASGRKYGCRPKPSGSGRPGGAEGREYPWGSEAPDPDRANYGETNLGRVSPVGLFPRGSTPEGIADMGGNVWEWVEARNSDSSEHRVLPGGRGS